MQMEGLADSLRVMGVDGVRAGAEPEPAADAAAAASSVVRSPAKKEPTMGSQIHTLQRIMKLRPYHLDLNNAIVVDLEERYNKGVRTLADIMAFAEGAEAYVVGNWGDEGKKFIEGDPKMRWMGNLHVHRELDVLWEGLGTQVIEDLCSGENVSHVLDWMKVALVYGNKRKARCLATFTFK
jgi:hypothetical protein